MIEPADFCDKLGQQDIQFFCGVPDSLLKNLCEHIDNVYSSQQHIITANEGNAVALAMGRYMGNGKPCVVYMQNSGLGNAINPITSLAAPEVYSIPMLLVIGWRGEPGVNDEPQHLKQGQITEQQLQIMDIPYVVLDATSQLTGDFEGLLATMTEHYKPVALLIKKGTFAKTRVSGSDTNPYSLKREQALDALLEVFNPKDIVVSTTGKTSREVFELRKLRAELPSDFLTVGGMGHTSSIAMGVALAQPNKRVIAIDGDGSMLMHMGAIPIIGNHNVDNLFHIILNNQCHESVGGQPTVAGQLDIEKVALASGYSTYACAASCDEITSVWSEISQQNGPVLFEIKIAQGARSDLGRPTSSPQQNKLAFMRHIGSVE